MFKVLVIRKLGLIKHMTLVINRLVLIKHKTLAIKHKTLVIKHKILVIIRLLLKQFIIQLVNIQLMIKLVLVSMLDSFNKLVLKHIVVKIIRIKRFSIGPFLIRYYIFFILF